jgi:pimeloyl-ACP methyl ester carboxylesterase
MTTFVLVHGAFHGGWCWRLVAAELRSRGHQVFTPTLTGLGERSHLATPEVDLGTHIEDVINVLAWEDLQSVMLVGHSYGGLVVGGVAERVPERLAGLIYLDAIVPENGRSALDFQVPERRQTMEEAAAGYNGWQLPPVPAEFYGVTDPDQAAWVDGHCTPQPFATFRQASQLSGAGEGVPLKAYIRCTQTPLGYMQQFVERAEQAPDWQLLYIDTGHDCMVTEPERLTHMLIGLV